MYPRKPGRKLSFWWGGWPPPTNTRLQCTSVWKIERCLLSFRTLPKRLLSFRTLPTTWAICIHSYSKAQINLLLPSRVSFFRHRKSGSVLVSFSHYAVTDQTKAHSSQNDWGPRIPIWINKKRSEKRKRSVPFLYKIFGQIFPFFDVNRGCKNCQYFFTTLGPTHHWACRCNFREIGIPVSAPVAFTQIAKKIKKLEKRSVGFWVTRQI